ncbi:MAG TPA: RcnB family protein [Croceicoccus sp.]|nr:RcnB family protein [Croceicoccus sp.]
MTGALLATSMLAGAPIAQAATTVRGAQVENTVASANLAEREQRGGWQSNRGGNRASARDSAGSQSRQSGSVDRSSRSSGESRSAERSGRDWNQSSRRSDTGQARSSERSGRDWNQSSRRSETAQTRSGREWNRSDRSEQVRPARTVERNATTDRTWQGRTNSGDGDRFRSTRDRNTSYRDRDRNGSYRDGYRDGVRTGDRNGSYGDGYRDADRDHRKWDKRWRDNNRYNWHHHRSYNRDIYRLGRYYSPYRDYSYRRLYIGFSLGSLFYSSRYWINDPWRYRLPEVYGPYRWVRYYDDVLLVDMYSGEVVDVIYDFFW